MHHMCHLLNNAMTTSLKLLNSWVKPQPSSRNLRITYDENHWTCQQKYSSLQWGTRKTTKNTKKNNEKKREGYNSKKFQPPFANQQGKSGNLKESDGKAWYYCQFDHNNRTARCPRQRTRKWQQQKLCWCRQSSQSWCWQTLLCHCWAPEQQLFQLRRSSMSSTCCSWSPGMTIHGLAQHPIFLSTVVFELDARSTAHACMVSAPVSFNLIPFQTFLFRQVNSGALPPNIIQKFHPQCHCHKGLMTTKNNRAGPWSTPQRSYWWPQTLYNLWITALHCIFAI